MKNALPLENKRVAILATDGFEQSELLEPQRALHEAGATTAVLSHGVLFPRLAPKERTSMRVNDPTGNRLAGPMM